VELSNDQDRDFRQPYFNNLQIVTPVTTGSVPSTDIHVRLRTSNSTGSFSGNITANSTRAIQREVSVSGTVQLPPIPSITSSSINGSVGTPLTATINATSEPSSYSAGTLPPGLSLNSTTGVISGTPTTVGNTTVSVNATNLGGTGSGNLTFNIGKGIPVITAPPTASPIFLGQQLRVSNLTGGVANISGNFSFTTPSQTPPAGNSSVSVTFTPSTAASSNWNSTTLNVTIQVSADPPGVPQITNPPINAKVGEELLNASVIANNGPFSYNAT
jgi:hypothetical protein